PEERRSGTGVDFGGGRILKKKTQQYVCLQSVDCHRRNDRIQRAPTAAVLLFFFSSRRRHTRWTGGWSSDVCSSDLSMITSVTFWKVIMDRSEERRVGKEC